ncbi:hypothetical protein CHARACLAT_008409 [Characodon lateralis]|uniref:Uncharacterized protein n=1 Tax=Characodon lateralis TaxID=208331 RepID=A0ABU7DT28_9TELE|nr:hypothetical protein [Characodon lateralis]
MTTFMSSEYSLFALPMTDFNYSPDIWMSTLALKTDYHFSPNLPGLDCEGILCLCCLRVTNKETQPLRSLSTRSGCSPELSAAHPLCHHSCCLPARFSALQVLNDEIKEELATHDAPKNLAKMEKLPTRTDLRLHE